VIVDQPDHCGCDRLIDIAIRERTMQASSNTDRFSGGSGLLPSITARN